MDLITLILIAGLVLNGPGLPYSSLPGWFMHGMATHEVECGARRDAA